MEMAVVFSVAFAATLLSSMSGGGTGIILFPVYLSLGMSYPLVSAISAVNSAVWVLPAARNYLKGRNIDWLFIIFFSLIGLVGSYVGVLFITRIAQRPLEIVVGVIILVLVVYTFLNKELGSVEQRSVSGRRQLLAYPAALIFGFYETIFGSGNGILVTATTFYTKGFDFIDGLGHYYVISFVWTLFTAILLIRQGFFDVPTMAVSAVGALLGAYIGSKYARNKGNRFIKLLFVTIGGILGLKLLFGL